MGESGSEELESVSLSTMIERFGENMIPLVEDLAEWLSKLLQIEFTVDTFLGQLDNGVLVCKIAEAVQQAAEGFSQEQTLPPFAMKYHKNAKTGTFFARDNVAYFLQWCKQSIGVPDSVLFESDGLVLHKQPREVVLCLMEVARVAEKYGIEPPGLVKLEHEIDGEEAKTAESSPVKQNARKTTKGFSIDGEVARIATKYNVEIERIREGRYVVERKINIFVRIVRSHVMVRVGGGWDTLEHFISRHDPNKIGKIMTSTPSREHCSGSHALRRDR